MVSSLRGFSIEPGASGWKLNFLAVDKGFLYLRVMALLSHLRSFQALDAALRCGSLKAAADTLGITPAAVGPIKELVRKVDLAELSAAMTGWLAEPERNLRSQLSAWADARDIEYD
jgi:hypothetical protein